MARIIDNMLPLILLKCILYRIKPLIFTMRRARKYTMKRNKWKSLTEIGNSCNCFQHKESRIISVMVQCIKYLYH